MATLNKALLIGRLGRDPVLRSLANGTAVLELSVATNHKDKEEGEDIATWHKVVMYGKRAERVHGAKGSLVYVEGRISQRKYTPKGESVERIFTEIVADKCEVLSGSGGLPVTRKDPTEEEAIAPSATQVAKEIAKKNIKQSGFDDFEDLDDIPF